LELNLTQESLAKKSGISLGSLKRFENKAEISLKHLLMMAVVLNATEEFYRLFSKKQYQNIAEVLISKKAKTRQRARTHV
jgi:transcriptional regulator with XRE-family HTH domain